jgi:O-antigen/teichoic acid export membrane protein
VGLIQKSGIFFFGRALPALIGLAGVALYTRMLDPASVGGYALLLSISLLASAVGFSWLRVAALRLAAAGVEDENAGLIATVAVSFGATAVFVALIEALALHFLRPGLALSSLLLAVAAAAASAWYELNGVMLQARLSVFAWGMLNFGRAAGALLFSVLLISAGWKIDALLAGFVLGNCATVAFMGIWRPALRGRFDMAIFKRLFVFGWPSSVTAAFSQISPAFQRFTLDAAAGSSAVGLYAVSQDFTSQTLFVLIGSISLAGIPMAYKAKDQGGPVALRLQLLENARLIFAIALPAAVALAVLAGPIAHVFFGARFRAGAEVIMALIASAALIAGLRTYYFDQAFELALKTQPQATISFLGTLLVVVLSLILIPRYAAVGAAISSLGASVVWLLMSIVWGRRILPMPIPTRSWLKTGFAVAGMALAMEVVPARDGIAGLCAAIVFGAFSYCFLAVITRLDLIRSRFTRRFAWLQR